MSTSDPLEQVLPKVSNGQQVTDDWNLDPDVLTTFIDLANAQGQYMFSANLVPQWRKEWQQKKKLEQFIATNPLK